MSDYNNLTEPGIFKARLKQWGLKETDAGAVQFSVLYEVREQWLNKEWQPWPGTDYPTCFGNHTLIKKDGTLNDSQIKGIRDALEWRGGFADLENGDWSETEVKITCKANEYQGETTIRAEFMNPLQGGSGALLGNVEGDALKKLDAKFGGKLRALTGAAPKKPAPTREDALAHAGLDNGSKDEIGF